MTLTVRVRVRVRVRVKVRVRFTVTSKGFRSSLGPVGLGSGLELVVWSELGQGSGSELWLRLRSVFGVRAACPLPPRALPPSPSHYPLPLSPSLLQLELAVTIQVESLQ